MSTAISLKKGESQTFVASNMRVGAGWIAPKTKVKKVWGVKVGGGTEKEVDLDLITVISDQDNDPIRICWYQNEDAFQDGKVTSDGDNTTGKGVGDDETHRIKLSQLPSDVKKLVFLVTAFKEGVSFSDIEGADLNVYGDDGLLFTIRVKLNQGANAIAVATATQIEGSTWEIKALNEYARIGGTRDEIMSFAGQF